MSIAMTSSNTSILDVLVDPLAIESGPPGYLADGGPADSTKKATLTGLITDLEYGIILPRNSPPICPVYVNSVGNIP